MQTSSQPKLLPVPFADTGSKQSIPNDSQIGITAGRASYTDGFPPLTRTPLAAGGVPPFGTDFNGILNDITAAIRWSQAGAAYPFSSTFNTAISGYPKGARIPNSTFDGFWLNTTDGNTLNPENTTSALTGWVPSGFYGVTAITGLSGSSVTLTTLQAGRDRITLAGTLTANINLVVPAWIKRWEIINNCTGAFSVTVKTPSGTGVAVPAGSNMTAAGDGVNVSPAFAPGALISIQVITATGTYTPTSGTKSIVVEQVGGGAGGAPCAGSNSTTATFSGGGGGASYARFRLTSVPASVPCTVGGGGASGTAGGGTSFGTYCTTPGATTGSNGSTTSGGTAGGGSGGATPTFGSGVIQLVATHGDPGLYAAAVNTAGGNGGRGGNSPLGFGGRGAATGGGEAAGGFGAGGGGCFVPAGGATSTQVGGAGTGGVIIVYEYA